MKRAERKREYEKKETKRIRQIRKLKWKELKQRRERATRRAEMIHKGVKKGKFQTKQPWGNKGALKKEKLATEEERKGVKVSSRKIKGICEVE